MSKLAIASTLALLAILGTVTYLHTTTAPGFRGDTQLRAIYRDWKAEYGKTYSGSEDSYRFGIFADNYRYVQEFNAVPRTFTVGLNHFSDLTTEEFTSLYLGLRKPESTEPFTEEIAPRELVESFGATTDWRSKKAVTDVKNQGQCGSCWSFATVGALETLNFLKGTKKLTLLSEQQFVDCDTANFGCNGGWMSTAIQYAIKNGVQTGADYPYKGVAGTCAYNKNKTVFKPTSVKTGTSDATLETALTAVPVTVAINADSKSFQSYKSGVYDDQTCSTDINHAVLAVGNAVEGKLGYWIIKNSWGTGWGDKGYIKLSRRTGNGTCGINKSFVWPQ